MESDPRKRIQRTLNRVNVLFHDVGIDFGGFHAGMAHEFLNHPDIDPVFQQVRSKRMPKIMQAWAFSLASMRDSGKR